MHFSKVNTVSEYEGDISLISAETDVGRGLYHFGIVGLPDKAVGESRERISAAIKNSGFDSPKTKNHKIISSLIPAHIKKTGSSFDLPIALSYLNAIGIIRNIPPDYFFLGELSLDGNIRSIKDPFKLLLGAYKLGVRTMFLPYEDVLEIKMLLDEFQDICVYPGKDLREIVEHLIGIKNIEKIKTNCSIEDSGGAKIETNTKNETSEIPDLEDILDQYVAKRALIISLAGGHHLFLMGQPGTGKTLIAQASQNIIPDMTSRESIEQRSIFNSKTSNRKDNSGNSISRKAPFRSPHHTSSYTSIIGSASRALPGEISKAHGGVLLLDELPEFDRRVIEALREPMEEGVVRLARQKDSLVFPARPIIIATANPCPCGYRGSNIKRCICKASDIQRYERKLSGPFMDRMDIFVTMTEAFKKDPLENKSVRVDIRSGISSKYAEKIILEARERQMKRCQIRSMEPILNAEIKLKNIFKLILLDSESEMILEQGIKTLGLSVRGKHKVMKVARTIADLDASLKVKASHILEALSLRQKDI